MTVGRSAIYLDAEPGTRTSSTRAYRARSDQPAPLRQGRLGSLLRAVPDPVPEDVRDEAADEGEDAEDGLVSTGTRIYRRPQPDTLSSNNLVALADLAGEAAARRGGIARAIETCARRIERGRAWLRLGRFFLLRPFFTQARLEKLDAALLRLEQAQADLQALRKAAIIDLDFTLSEEGRTAYLGVVDAFRRLTVVDGIWSVPPGSDLMRHRHDAAASKAVAPQPVQFTVEGAPEFRCPLPVMRFGEVAGVAAYLMPGMIAVRRSAGGTTGRESVVDFGLLDFRDLTLQFMPREIVPEEVMPREAAGAKRRRDDEYGMPASRYGDLVIASETGLYERFMVSDWRTLDAFRQALAEFEQTLARAKSGREEGSTAVPYGEIPDLKLPALPRLPWAAGPATALRAVVAAAAVVALVWIGEIGAGLWLQDRGAAPAEPAVAATTPAPAPATASAPTPAPAAATNAAPAAVTAPAATPVAPAPVSPEPAPPPQPPAAVAPSAPTEAAPAAADQASAAPAPAAPTPPNPAPVDEAPAPEAPVAPTPVASAPVAEAPLLTPPVVTPPVAAAPTESTASPTASTATESAPAPQDSAAPTQEAPTPPAPAPAPQAPPVQAPVASTPATPTPATPAPAAEASAAPAPTASTETVAKADAPVSPPPAADSAAPSLSAVASAASSQPDPIGALVKATDPTMASSTAPAAAPAETAAAPAASESAAPAASASAAPAASSTAPAAPASAAPDASGTAPSATALPASEQSVIDSALGKPAADTAAMIPVTKPATTTPGQLSEADIKVLQSELSNLGYYDGPADGQLGQSTLAAFNVWRGETGRHRSQSISQRDVRIFLYVNSALDKAPADLPDTDLPAATKKTADKPSAQPSSKPNGSTSAATTSAATTSAATSAKPSKATDTTSDTAAAEGLGQAEITELQTQLSNLGYYEGPTDGRINRGTVTAFNTWRHETGRRSVKTIGQAEYRAFLAAIAQ
ncbi:MAG TPA: peptidoglycan-binding domain-containing protein [Candidatus Binatia bacterium]|nr:peptidoglycan-binding domain-containing protein [Candidatus Binatia bacterium]